MRTTRTPKSREPGESEQGGGERESAPDGSPPLRAGDCSASSIRSILRERGYQGGSLRRTGGEAAEPSPATEAGALYESERELVLRADAASGAASLAPGTVDAVLTSPPYFGLRSYLAEDDPDKHLEVGSERTPEAYIGSLVEVFAALRHALKESAVVWVNVGDGHVGYWGDGPAREEGRPSVADRRGFSMNSRPRFSEFAGAASSGAGGRFSGLKPKDLLGLPFALGQAMREAGFYWRATVPWIKPAALPEAKVTDRPHCAHEYLLLFSASARSGFRASGSGAGVSGRSLTSADIHYHSIRQAIAHHEAEAGRLSGALGPGDVLVEDAAGEAPRALMVRPRAERLCRGRHYGAFPASLARLLLGHSLSSAFASASADAGEAADAPVVADPFAGTGTTAFAARSLGARFVGFELDASMAAPIRERLAQEPLF